MLAKLGETFTLAGIGALLAGMGSLLTAIVGMRMSQKKGREEALNEMGGDGDEHGLGSGDGLSGEHGADG
jgi:hypothetical protein